MTTDTTYNGWKNKETWLVNIWYMDSMPDYFASDERYHVSPNGLKEVVTYMTAEYESLTSLPAGLLSDFINTCWDEVDWRSLADHLNDTLKEMEG